MTGEVEALASDTLSASELEVLVFPLFISFLIPRTDHAVVKSVKRKPPMTTENTLRTWRGETFINIGTILADQLGR